MYHKTVHGNIPAYLKEHLPPFVSSTNPYHRRRPVQRRVPKHKTETYRQLFSPSTTTLWKNIPEKMKRTKSVSQVKHFPEMTQIIRLFCRGITNPNQTVNGINSIPPPPLPLDFCLVFSCFHVSLHKNARCCKIS